VNQASQPYNGGPDRAHPCTAGDDSRSVSGAHEAPVSRLTVVPVSLAEARDFIANFHRHNKPPRGHVFSIGASFRGDLVGVATIGRPVAAYLDDGATLEVNRLCVVDAAPKGACSFLYSRAWRAANALGWSRLVTYILQSESGASLRGAGWRCIAKTRGRANGWMNRPGREWQPVVGQPKLRWEVP